MTKSTSPSYLFVANNPIVSVDKHGLDIFIQQGNNSWNPVNNTVHRAVCVDTYTQSELEILLQGGTVDPSGRACFSFAETGLGFTLPKSTWLGFSDWVIFVGCLKGKIYEQTYMTGPVGLNLITTWKQDLKWLNYMRNFRVGHGDVYSVGNHNCAKFTNLAFADAPNHMGPP